jgi:hypothetical protein
MAYLRPSAFQRVFFNRVAMLTGIGGSKTLTTTGRTSGKQLDVPVVPVEYDGVTYLVCPRGEAHWVKNVRAAGGKAKLEGKPISLTELPSAEIAPILEAYKKKAGRAVTGYFKQLPDAADHPTFRVDQA